MKSSQVLYLSDQRKYFFFLINQNYFAHILGLKARHIELVV